VLGTVAAEGAASAFGVVGDGPLGEAAGVGAAVGCEAGALGSGVEAAAAGDCVADGEVAAGVLGAAAGGDDEFGLSLAAGGDVTGAG
jgi:hypothetical protein